MHFVKTTKLGHRRGNCLATVVACFIDQPVDEVPNVETMFNIANPKYHWGLILQNWLNENGFLLTNADGFKIFHPEFDNPMTQEEYHSRKNKLKGKFYFLNGYTALSLKERHVCIYRDGLLVHDPSLHPTGGIIITKDTTFSTIVKL